MFVHGEWLWLLGGCCTIGDIKCRVLQEGLLWSCYCLQLQHQHLPSSLFLCFASVIPFLPWKGSFQEFISFHTVSSAPFLFLSPCLPCCLTLYVNTVCPVFAWCVRDIHSPAFLSNCHSSFLQTQCCARFATGCVLASWFPQSLTYYILFTWCSSLVWEWCVDQVARWCWC